MPYSLYRRYDSLVSPSTTYTATILRLSATGGGNRGKISIDAHPDAFGMPGWRQRERERKREEARSVGPVKLLSAIWVRLPPTNCLTIMWGTPDGCVLVTLVRKKRRVRHEAYHTYIVSNNRPPTFDFPNVEAMVAFWRKPKPQPSLRPFPCGGKEPRPRVWHMDLKARGSS